MIIDFTFLDIEKNWNDILTTVYNADKMLHALLRDATPRRLWSGLDGLDTPILEITVRYEYHTTQLQARHTDIERAILVRTGIALVVKPMFLPYQPKPVAQDS